MSHYVEKHAANPSGLLMYHPVGTRPFAFGKMLTIEFATELLEATSPFFSSRSRASLLLPGALVSSLWQESWLQS